MTENHRWVWRLATAGWAAVILFGSVIPIAPSLAPGHLDKLYHVCEYLLLGWLLVPSWPWERGRAKAQLQAWMVATCYGLIIEGIQTLLPWRSGDWVDAAANGLGALFGVIAWLIPLVLLKPQQVIRR